MPRYYNLDVEIGMGIQPHVGVSPGKGKDYQVTAEYKGEKKRAMMHFPFDEQILGERLREVEDFQYDVTQRAQGEQAIQNFGQALFDALFSGDIRNLYEARREQLNREEDERLRVRLRIEPLELAVLPWELMYDPGKRDYLCLDRDISLVRYKEARDVLPSLKEPLPLKILGIASETEDQASPNIIQVKSEIKKKLKSLGQKKKARLTWLQGGTSDDLRRETAGQVPWNILHFIGHGREGSILLVDAEKKSSSLSVRELNRFLSLVSLRLVILNTCEGQRGERTDNFTRTASELTSKTIPAVIAMQFKIRGEAAVKFARAFYETLVKGGPIDVAVTEARLAMQNLPNSLEWAAPVLHMCSKDGIIFSFETEKADGTPPPPSNGKRKPPISIPVLLPVLVSLLILAIVVGGIIYGLHNRGQGPTPLLTPTSNSLRPYLRPTPGPFSCVAGSITINGSTALSPLLMQVASDYMQKCHSANITVLESDSGTGLKLAEEGLAGIGSSDLSVEELFSRSAMTDLVDYQVAGVIFAVIVNEKVGITNLSSDQLKKIYTGVYTNWDKVGGPNLKITAYSRHADSGTRVTFERYVLGESQGITMPEPLDNTQEMITKVHDTPGAIGYASLYDINQPNAPHVFTISINLNQPNINNINGKTYLFWNIEHLYTKGPAKGLAKAFIDYVGSASNFIQAHSFIIITQLPASH